jgi:hypothetical protein
MAKKSILNNYLNQIVKTLAEEIAVTETKRLRQNASDASWPSDVVDQLTVATKDKGHTVTYPDRVKNRVMDLEYGTPSTPPSPVIRSILLGVK